MANLERRVELSPDLVASLDRIDNQFEADAGRPPWLPAPVTPPQLVTWAEELVAAFAGVPSNWARDAYEQEMQPLIDAALDASLTEQVAVPYHKILHDSPESLMPLSLVGAIERFTSGISDSGYLADSDMNQLRMWRFIQKRKIVRKRGFEWELSDEEWGAL